MTWHVERGIWLASVLAMSMLFCNSAALAQPSGKGDQPQAKQAEGQGGLKGGRARAAKMTPEQRAETARKAAKARWGK